jgi:membrane associated rhomboid family serine protease
MVTASVGFQCPECARSGAKAQRLVDVHRRATVPYVTYGLIAANVAAFIIGSIASAQFDTTGVGGDFTRDYGLFTPLVGNGEWWRLITSGFLHSGMLHLALNMWALYVLGKILEPALGRARFGLAYAVSLVGGSFGVVLGDTISDSTRFGVTVGASGAIFGLMGLLAVLFWVRGISLVQSGILPILGLNLAFTFFVDGISKGGHIGGLITGAAVGAILFLGTQASRPSREEMMGRTAAVAVLGVVCFALSIVLAQNAFAI